TDYFPLGPLRGSIRRTTDATNSLTNPSPPNLAEDFDAGRFTGVDFFGGGFLRPLPPLDFFAIFDSCLADWKQQHFEASRKGHRQ
ncbi:MAG: hypothetical protein M3O03_07665, partial [Pseudomonadota bacterium]|nr:hypothetical protein [Pseudomonadota bacterium]